MDGTDYETEYETIVGFMALPDGAKLFLSARDGKLTEEWPGELLKRADGTAYILHNFEIPFYNDDPQGESLRGFKYAYYVAEQDDLHGWAFVDHLPFA